MMRVLLKTRTRHGLPSIDTVGFCAAVNPNAVPWIVICTRNTNHEGRLTQDVERTVSERARTFLPPSVVIGGKAVSGTGGE